ncbi:MAG: hypothetical protein LUE24_04265 [Lachnospiraceae bacterium]|nr:hypothetical protein [Lachnospiraceae bacterium]
MHKGKWGGLEVKELSKDRLLWCYQSESNYTAAMLVEDLLEAGFTISQIKYMEVAGIWPICQVGSYDSAERFLNAYSWLCKPWMSGMQYQIFCEHKGMPCEFWMSDDGFGRSRNSITLSGMGTDQMKFLAERLGFFLQKKENENARQTLKVYREWHDVILKKIHRTYQLEPERLYFLTVFFSEDEEFMGYSFDVEAAADSHYLFGEKGEKRLRGMLGYGEDAGTLAEVLVDYFFKGGDGSALKSAAYRVCSEWYHFD